jgi:hypothetical protein
MNLQCRVAVLDILKLYVCQYGTQIECWKTRCLKKHLPSFNMRHDEDVERCRIQYDTTYRCIEF